MHGIINIHKQPGPTSHDVVAGLRRVLRQKRIGHAGTLDPAARGVLLICLGNATRIVEYLVDQPKTYRAVATFGAETDTEDQTGSIVSESDCTHVTRQMLEEVLPQFTGKILQTPPMVSAVHHQGQRLYEIARAGRTVERAARPVEIYSLSLISFEPGCKAQAVLDVQCSKGTYIRTLCADIGKALGCGGFMSDLVRTAVGPFHIEDAVTVEAVEEAFAEGRIADVIHSMDDALADMPSVMVAETDAARAMNGVMLPEERLAQSRESLPAEGIPVRIHSPGRGLLGIGQIIVLSEGRRALKPDKIFPIDAQG